MMQADQVLLPIAYMGTLGPRGLHHVQEEMYHRDDYSDDSMFSNNRFIFFQPPSPPPSIAPEGAVAVAVAVVGGPKVGKGGESSSGQSQGNSASDEAEEQQNNNNSNILIIDERKQRRMLSNRESARRSRMRKQKHLDELRAQVAHMRAENRQMMSTLEIASRSYSQILEENRLLKTQKFDLSQQLQQLHQVLAASQSAASIAAALNILASNPSTTTEIDHPRSELSFETLDTLI